MVSGYDARMWDLNRLRIWRAVVATGSVVAAAKNLNYTPATVSQHITTLQKSVVAPLYRRSGRGIEITEFGRRLAEESGEVFTSVARLDDLVENFRNVSRPRLRIAAFTSFNARLLPGSSNPSPATTRTCASTSSSTNRRRIGAVTASSRSGPRSRRAGRPGCRR